MRVLLDTTYARRAPHSGTAVYLSELGRALRGRNGIEVVEVADARRAPAGGGRSASVRNALADARWSAMTLPALARERRADVIHHGLPAHAASHIPQVITVHDLAFERLPERFDRRFRAFARHAHRWAARRAGAVVCVSETTAAEVRARWGIAHERIIVALHGPGQALPAAAPRERTHFLYVGDAEPRKDLPTLLAAYARYRRASAAPHPLILAGSAQAAGAGVRCEPGPDPSRLAELYAGALALVHPSLDEGFGMTPLEAMRAGAPVIAAAAPAVVEVCGDAALYVPPGDPPALAAALAALADDAARREALGTGGRVHVRGYSWEASAERHVDAYAVARRR